MVDQPGGGKVPGAVDPGAGDQPRAASLTGTRTAARRMSRRTRNDWTSNLGLPTNPVATS
jgi:hypothetical protein